MSTHRYGNYLKASEIKARCITCVGSDSGKPSDWKRAEARILPEICAESPASSACYVGQLTTYCSILNHSCPLIGTCWYRYSLTWFAIPLRAESFTNHFLIPSKQVILGGFIQEHGEVEVARRLTIAGKQRGSLAVKSPLDT